MIVCMPAANKVAREEEKKTVQPYLNKVQKQENRSVYVVILSKLNQQINHQQQLNIINQKLSKIKQRLPSIHWLPLPFQPRSQVKTASLSLSFVLFILSKKRKEKQPEGIIRLICSYIFGGFINTLNKFLVCPNRTRIS